MPDSSYNLINSTGTVVADTSATQQEVVDNVVDSLGISRSVAEDSSTTEGRLVELLTYARQSVARNNAKLANQINPNLAEDGFFDAIFAIFGGARTAAARSSVTCQLTGVAGTVIPAGSYIRNSSTRTLWYSNNDVTIDSNNSASVLFYSDDFGAITAGVGELTQIVSQVTGWETVTNAEIATEGNERQSLPSAKISRVRQLAKNARTTMGAVIANIDPLDGVIGAVGRENRLNSPQVIDNITIPAKSTWICVDGGNLAEISEQYVIHTHGTGFYGFSNTENGSYTDPRSGQVYDQTIAIDRPIEVPLLIEVTATLTSSVDLVSSVKEAIQEWAAGNIDGYAGCMLAESISPFEISAALNLYFGASSINVNKVRISTVADNTLGYDDLLIELWEKASITNDNITVIQS